ncbi:MAG: hypothetical protein GX871_00880 [Microbacteriaceae bacterium]|nr:hypothetical protein [Microbacteriaceae bacterium]
MIAGWAPDSTLWLTDVTHEWSEPRQQWHRLPGGDEWGRDEWVPDEIGGTPS